MADVAVHLGARRRAVKRHESQAHVVWIDHKNGGSTRLRSGTGAFSAIPTSLGDNGDATDRATTPCELLAAAHATSFIATLAELLTRDGTPARELEAHATCEIESDECGRRITAAHLRVCGRDTQLDGASFSKVCEQALGDCPISRALHPGIPITLNARVLDARQPPAPPLFARLAGRPSSPTLSRRHHRVQHRSPYAQASRSLEPHQSRSRPDHRAVTPLDGARSRLTARRAWPAWGDKPTAGS